MVLLGATRALAFDPVVVGSWPEPGPYHLSAYQVQIAGERIYLTDDSDVRIIDISEPGQPQSVGTYRAGYFKEGPYDAGGGGEYSVALQGNTAFVSYTEEVNTGPSMYLYGSGIDAVDLTNPGKPMRTAHVFTQGSLQGQLARRIAVAGTNLYAAQSLNGHLQVYGVSDPATIRPLGAPIGSTIEYPKDVVGAVRFAYLAGDVGLEVIDSEHYGGPAVVGRLNLYSNPIAVAVAGQYAYVSLPWAGLPQPSGLLEIVDVSRANAPKAIAAYQTTPSLHRAAIRGGYAYLAADIAGLEVIDVHDPKKPKHVTTLNLGLVNDIAIGGCYAYVAAGTNGLQVVQIDDQPSLSIDSSATGASLQLDGVFGQSYVIESCASLPAATGWTSVTNVSLTNATQVVLDTLATTDKARFYRARQNP